MIVERRRLAAITLLGAALLSACSATTPTTRPSSGASSRGGAVFVTPARFCEEMQRAQPESAPAIELVIFPRGPHTFDMRLPDRTVLGMRLGYDPEADAGARRAARHP